jgi:RNA polymerase sigma-70 factor, ECF subfamily
MDSTNLIRRCQAGQAEAITDLILQHEKRVFRLALSILDDAESAGEVTQDVFVAAINGLDGYRGDAAFTTWLSGITINICRKRIRKRMARQRLVKALQSIFQVKSASIPNLENTTIKRETDAAVMAAINELREIHRLPILLYYYHDFSVTEIAQALDIPEGTVLSRLYTARERLRLTLDAELLSE